MARTPKPYIPAKKDYVLFVEGEDDKSFFTKIIALTDLNADIPNIQVAPPKEFNGKDSKGGIFERLPFLLEQIKDGTLSKLAIVVDADYDKKEGGGLGCQRTIDKIAEIVSVPPYHFALTERPKLQSGGLLFKSSNGYNTLGLWVMPDNQQDGMLEDFIKDCIKSDELALFNYAKEVVKNVPNKKFEEHHHSKAEVATWIAWQKPPGHGIYYSVRENNLLLDEESKLFKELKVWLKQVFKT
jgi:hypothetical protein